MFRIKLWLLIFSIILILLNKFSFVGKLRDGFSIFVLENAEFIQNKISNYPKLLVLDTNKQKNLELENSRLKKQIEEYALIAREKNNNDLAKSDLANLSSINYPTFNSIIARAAIDLNYLVNNKLLINKGSLDNLAISNTVVNKDGVIGQVSSINDSNSQVTLVTSPDFKIYLQDQKYNTKMLAMGIGNNNLIVKYIDKSVKIEVGDTLSTTGLDDLYPGNLPVARVIKIFNEENGFNSALCVPVVNFNHLQYVVVLRKNK